MSNDEQPAQEAGPSALDRSRVLEGAEKLLADGVPRRAKDIASALSQIGAWVDKSLVNSVLSKEGKEQFSYDRATFTYRLASVAETAPAIVLHPEAAVASTHTRSAVLAAARRLLMDGKPRTAREITAQLSERGMAGLNKAAVSSVLSREGKEEFEYDKESYTYRLAGAVRSE